MSLVAWSSPVTVLLVLKRPGKAMTLVYLTVAWIGGILLARLLWSQGVIGCTTPSWPFALSAGLVALAAVLLRRRPQERMAAVVLLFCILGAWRYQAHPYAACPTADDLAFYNGDEKRAVWAAVEGVVAAYPDVRDVQTQYRLRVDTLTVGEQTHSVTGDLLVQASRFPAHAYGDRLRVTGQLQTPPRLDDFDYEAYLAQRGIHSLMRRARVERLAEGQGNPFWALLYGLKAHGSALLSRVLPEPAAALANGMLLGIESGIPDDVNEAFKATGTSHVIVISGSNIALLSAIFMAGLSRLLGKRRAVWPAVIGISLYVLLVGADAAALRAGVMGVLFVIAIYLGRQSTAYVSLCASALFMTLWNPLTLWDIGFQLSFMATLGLILFTPTIGTRFEQLLNRGLAQEQTRRVMGVLNDALIVTLAAQVTTLPVIVYYFGRVSLISLVTNFLILPAQPPIMTGGMATLAAGLAWEPLGRGLALIPWLFLTYTTAVVRLTAGVPFASAETGALGRGLALVYLAVAGRGADLARAAPSRPGLHADGSGHRMGRGRRVADLAGHDGPELGTRWAAARDLRAGRGRRSGAGRHAGRQPGLAMGWSWRWQRTRRRNGLAADGLEEGGRCRGRPRRGCLVARGAGPGPGTACSRGRHPAGRRRDVDSAYRRRMPGR